MPKSLRCGAGVQDINVPPIDSLTGLTNSPNSPPSLLEDQKNPPSEHPVAQESVAGGVHRPNFEQALGSLPADLKERIDFFIYDLLNFGHDTAAERLMFWEESSDPQMARLSLNRVYFTVEEQKTIFFFPTPTGGRCINWWRRKWLRNLTLATCLLFARSCTNIPSSL